MSSLRSLEFWVAPKFLENLFALNHFYLGPNAKFYAYSAVKQWVQ